MAFRAAYRDHQVQKQSQYPLAWTRLIFTTSLYKKNFRTEWNEDYENITGRTLSNLICFLLQYHNSSSNSVKGCRKSIFFRILDQNNWKNTPRLFLAVFLGRRHTRISTHGAKTELPFNNRK